MFETPCVAFLFDSVHTVNIVVLGVVILIVFGPERLPGIARKLGRMMETFRRAADEFKTQIMAMDQEPKTEPPPHPNDTPSDLDGVSQSSADASSGDTYTHPHESSPYPGNEQYYNNTDTSNRQEQTPPKAETEAMPEQPETVEAEAKPPESEHTS